MVGYKALNKDWKCMGFRYELGKTYELPEGEKLQICKNGFHFCENIIDVFGFYPWEDTVVVKIEALGEIQQEGTKFCTDRIRIAEEVDRDHIVHIVEIAIKNSGDFNSGDRNSGNFNSGNCNSGYYNSGDFNSGNRNSGNRNAGDFNSGNFNSGHCNSGECNSGDYNSGDYNSGHFNSGYYNSGYYNSGYYNSGYYNLGNHNSGFFNTDDPTVRLFNKDSGITFSEFMDLGIDFHNLENSLDIIKKLPNFDAAIFKECTGIDVEG